MGLPYCPRPLNKNSTEPLLYYALERKFCRGDLPRNDKDKDMSAIDCSAFAKEWNRLLLSALLSKSIRILVPGRLFAMNRTNPICTADVTLKDKAQLLEFAKFAARQRALKDQITRSFGDATAFWASHRALASRRVSAVAAADAPEPPAQPTDERDSSLSRAAPQVGPKATLEVTTLLDPADAVSIAPPVGRGDGAAR